MDKATQLHALLFLSLSCAALFVEADQFCSRAMATKACANPPTVDNINMGAYLGTWYEIGSTASFKLLTESGLACNQARYSSTPDGRLTLLNSGLKVIGPLAIAEVGAINVAARGVCAGAREVCSQLAAVSQVRQALNDVANKSTPAQQSLLDIANDLAKAAEAAGLSLQGIAEDVSLIQQLNGKISQANYSSTSSLESSIADMKEYVEGASKEQHSVAGAVWKLNKIRAQIWEMSHNSSTEKNKQALEQASLSLASISLKVGATTAAMEVALKAVGTGASALLKNGHPLDDGQVSSVTGHITQPSDTSAGKLEVVINGVKAPYWIIGLESASAGSYYSAALVYSCSEVAGVTAKSLFVLSREPQLEKATLVKFLTKAESLGIYNDCEDPFLLTLQRGGECGQPIS